MQMLAVDPGAITPITAGTHYHLARGRSSVRLLRPISFTMSFADTNGEG